MAASLADLKAITAEHVDNFDANGRTAVRGANKKVNKQLDKSKDPFDRPSPGLVKRLAAEARNDAKRRHFSDQAGPSDEQRRNIMLAKAKKYDAMRRGDYSGMTDKELAEVVVDFDRKWEDNDSDVDESETVPLEDDLLQVEYIDEMGRTRIGSVKDKRDAERTRQRREPSEEVEQETAYAEVLRSNVIRGDQRQYPVYEPDPDKMRAKWKEAEEQSRPQHYDSSKDVRVKGAGAYDFSQDQAERRKQQASLNEERLATEAARMERPAKKSKVEERKAMIEAKRKRLLGESTVDKMREEKRQAEADKLLEGLEKEWQQDGV